MLPIQKIADLFSKNCFGHGAIYMCIVIDHQSKEFFNFPPYLLQWVIEINLLFFIFRMWPPLFHHMDWLPPWQNTAMIYAGNLHDSENCLGSILRLFPYLVFLFCLPWYLSFNSVSSLILQLMKPYTIDDSLLPLYVFIQLLFGP